MHPDHQGRESARSTAYDQLLERLRRRDPAPTSLVSLTREDRVHAFSEKRGFEVVMRRTRSRLDLGPSTPTVSPPPWPRCTTRALRSTRLPS